MMHKFQGEGERKRGNPRKIWRKQAEDY